MLPEPSAAFRAARAFGHARRVFAIFSSPSLVAWIVALSTALKFWFVFRLTEYRSYLGADMGGYWLRALARQAGDETAVAQWGAGWPPAAHILLAQVFRLIHAAGLDGARLEIVLGIQILLSGASVYLLYAVALRVTRDVRAANATALLYGFSYPMIFLCAAVLSEGPAIPLLVAAVWLTVGRERLWQLSLGAATLSVAVAIRPAYAPMMAVFCAYILLRHGRSRGALLRGGVFAIVFALALTPVVLENARISGGRIKGLSPNAGVNFFLNLSKTHELRSHFGGYEFAVIPPATSRHPENGRVITRVPFYEQGWYFREGWKHLRARPSVLLDNLLGLDTVFFGPMMPWLPSAAGFLQVLPIFNIANLLVFLTIPALLWIAWSRRATVTGMRAEILFLAGLVLVSFATMYVFGAEQRYLYSFLFAILLLSVIAVRAVISRWQLLRRPMAVYAAALALVWGADSALAAARSRMGTRTVTVTVAQSREPITSLSDPRTVEARSTIEVDQLCFPLAWTLRHAKAGELGFRRNYFLEAETRFRFLTTGHPVTFEVYSDDGFRLEMDSIHLDTFERDREFPSEPDRSAVLSDGGQHTLRVSHFQGEGPQGLFVYYSVQEGEQRRRYPVGESSSAIEFLPVGTAEAVAVK